MSKFKTSTIDTSEKKYWFVRTDGGENFPAFYENNFVAIGWNMVTLAMLKAVDEGKIKNLIEKDVVKPNLIAKDKEYDPSSSHVKGRVTGILNKINSFNEVCKGDIVIIPSDSSNELAFGIIQDDDTYEKIDHLCEHYKRRNVKWINKIEIGKLDAKYSYITTPGHAISEINETYYDLIDSTMFSSYIRNGFSNIAIKIEQPEDIDYISLRTLLDGITDIAKEFNSIHVSESENLDLDKIFIKLNLQSPGFLNLKETGKGLLFALFLFATACNEDLSDGKYGNSRTKKIIDESGLNIPEQVIHDLKQSEDTLKVRFDNIDSLLAQ